SSVCVRKVKTVGGLLPAEDVLFVIEGVSKIADLGEQRPAHSFPGGRTAFSQRKKCSKIPQKPHKYSTRAQACLHWPVMLYSEGSSQKGEGPASRFETIRSLVSLAHQYIRQKGEEPASRFETAAILVSSPKKENGQKGEGPACRFETRSMEGTAVFIKAGPWGKIRGCEHILKIYGSVSCERLTRESRMQK